MALRSSRPMAPSATPMQLLQIGEVAEFAGLSLRTVRYDRSPRASAGKH